MLSDKPREKRYKVLKGLFYFRRLSDRAINILKRRRLISKAKVRFGHFLITDLWLVIVVRMVE